MAARPKANRAWETGEVVERLFFRFRRWDFGDVDTSVLQSPRVNVKTSGRHISLSARREPTRVQAFVVKSQVIESIAKEHDTTSHSHTASSGTGNGMLSISLHRGPGETSSALEKQESSQPRLSHKSNAATWPRTRTWLAHSSSTRWFTGQSITPAIISTGCCSAARCLWITRGLGWKEIRSWQSTSTFRLNWCQDLSSSVSAFRWEKKM